MDDQLFGSFIANSKQCDFYYCSSAEELDPSSSVTLTWESEEITEIVQACAVCIFSSYKVRSSSVHMMCRNCFDRSSPEFFRKPNYPGDDERYFGHLILRTGEKKLAFDDECSPVDLVFCALLTFFPWDNTDPQITPLDCGYMTEPLDFKDEVAVEFNYQGDTYTDVSVLGYYSKVLQDCSAVKFRARKNGGELSEYWLFPRVTFYGDKYQHEEKMVVLTDPINDATAALPTPSAGVVECVPGRRYVGAVYFTTPKTVAGVRNDDDDENIFYDDEDIPPYTETVYTYSDMHLFMETNGKDFTYYVLLCGRLLKKIEKTDRAVTFYYTPTNVYELEDESFTQEGNPNNIVFVKKGRQYVYPKYPSADEAPYGFFDSAIEMPSILKDADSVSMNDAFTLYVRCAEALANAFANSKRYTFDNRCFLEMIIHSGKNTYKIGEVVELKRAEKFKYSFCYGGAELILTSYFVRPYTPLDEKNIYFSEKFLIFFPYYTVDSITFRDEKRKIVFVLSDSEPVITLTDEEKGSAFSAPLNQFLPMLEFSSMTLPLNPVFSPLLNEVLDNFDLYTKLRDAIFWCGFDTLGGNFRNYREARRQYISRFLFEQNDMVPVGSIIDKALELCNTYDRTKKVPHLAIIGQAGTGKTTLAENLAKLFKKELLSLSPSDIKGAYVGHTKYEVVKNLADAALENKIFYLDEAYQLMSDVYGKEAVTILLPLMTGNRTQVNASLDRGQNDSIEIDFDKGTVKKNSANGAVSEEGSFPPGMIPIWLSGYEDEIRKMINMNQGLYRRLQKLTIQPPVTSDLMDLFDTALKEMADTETPKPKTSGKKTAKKNALPERDPDDASGKTAAKRLIKYFANNGTDNVKRFFNWGSQVQNSKYFANYAGVKRFVERCVDTIDLTGSDVKLGVQIEEIISSFKRDIKRQLAAVKNTSSSRLGETNDTGDTISVITDIDTRFSDLVGCGNQINYMKNIVEMLVNKSVYDNFNLKIPKGALMEGLPGTGKTFIARAMAGELQERFQELAPDKRFGFISFSGSELCEKPVSYISSLFSVADEYDACVMFIDEVDAIAKNRFENPHYGVYLELIRQMDGIEKNSNVFILAATNAPENLDPAFTRSGRIDKRLVFDLPDKDARAVIAKRAILKSAKTLKNFIPDENKGDIEFVAKSISDKTTGSTAGDIESVINLAFVAYHQFSDLQKEKSIENAYIGEASFAGYPFIRNESHEIKIINDPEDKDIHNKELLNFYKFVMEEIEKMRVGDINRTLKEAKFSTESNGNNCSSTAVHEVGHALVSYLLGLKTFDSITIIPRGKALGYVMPADQDYVTKKDFIKRIKVCMGGRIAEEIVYGKDDISAGAISDMKNATLVAHRMIEQFGFSEEFGFMTLSVRSGKYLGSMANYICSEEFREKSDIEVSKLLKNLYSETLGMLSGRKELIVKLAENVFNNETMSGEEFEKLLDKELDKSAT